jgi:hypothetical protein
LAAISPNMTTPAVQVTVNGRTFSARIGRMRGETLLGFDKAAREACGVKAGEEIEATIIADDAPREVEVPEALAQALASEPGARERFDALVYSHRKEFVRWITDAKREDTRQRRTTETLTMLRDDESAADMTSTHRFNEGRNPVRSPRRQRSRFCLRMSELVSGSQGLAAQLRRSLVRDSGMMGLMQRSGVAIVNPVDVDEVRAWLPG